MVDEKGARRLPTDDVLGVASDFHRQVNEALSTPEMTEALKRLQQSLQLPAMELSRIEPPALAHIEFPEPDPDQVAQPANIARMAEYTIATHQQLVDLARITAASLEESRQLREAMTRASRIQTGLTWAVVALTAVLVVLTYLLVAQLLSWWPF